MENISWIVRLVAEEAGIKAGAFVALRLIGCDVPEARKLAYGENAEDGGPGSGYKSPHYGNPGGNGGSRPRSEGAAANAGMYAKPAVESANTGNSKPYVASEKESGKAYKGHADEKEIREAANHPVINQKGMAKHENKAAAEKAMRDERSRLIQDDKERKKKGLQPRKRAAAPKSYFTVDVKKVERDVLKKIRNGDFYVYGREDGRLHYQTDLGYKVGKAYNENNEEIDSYTVSVLYSRKGGFHFCPTLLVEERKKVDK